MTRREPHLSTALVAMVIAGCGSSGGGGSPPVQAGVLQLGAASMSAGEGTGRVTLTVMRSGGSGGAVSARVATHDGTASAGHDYVAFSATVSFEAGEGAAKSITLMLLDDQDREAAETFGVTLSELTGGATAGSLTTATITIEDDDLGPTGRPLNGTGVTTCADATTNGLACNDPAAGTDRYPRQDGEVGRDLTDGDPGDGHAGFSFTKLGGDGVALSDQRATYASTPWSCVRDNVTRLVWEVKTDDGGLRDRDSTYTWFSSSGVGDGGSPGRSNGGGCADGPNCDSEAYARRLDGLALCARTGWRLPTRSELFSLLDYGAGAPPFLEGSVFANSPGTLYWTSDSDGTRAAVVDTRRARLRSAPKEAGLQVLLVSEEE